MNIILNALLAVLAGWLALWVAGEIGAPRQIAVIAGVLVGILVFLASPL